MLGLWRKLWRRAQGRGQNEPQARSRLVISRRVFELSPDLIAELRRLREVHGYDEIMREHDAFLLDPGLGPATYLASDGRVLWDDDRWDVKGRLADAFAAICVGIEKTGIGGLSALLPSRTPNAVDCGDCDGTGRFDAHGQMVDTEGRPFSFVCPACAGLGWKSPSLCLEESVLGTS